MDQVRRSASAFTQQTLATRLDLVESHDALEAHDRRRDVAHARLRTVAVICGALADPQCEPPDLRAVHAALAPYGAVQVWDGRVARSHVALGGHTNSETLFASADEGRLIVCADAHLTDRARLARDLDRPATSSDAELILHAYRRWGGACAEHLDGAFAFAVADSVRGGLLLVRDHLGARPLVIHRREGITAFASTALALTGLPGVGHELDIKRVAEVLLLAYASERTFVTGVRWVPPGSATWITAESQRTWAWWRPGEIEPNDLGSAAAHAEQLRSVLDDAVARALERTARPGVLLSGGLDSASVAAVAALQQDPDQVRTYTSVPPATWNGTVPNGWIADERFALEALVERHPNLRPSYFEVTGGSLFDLHENTWELGAGPSRNPVNMMWILGIRREAAADGVDRLLSGGAGNVAFSADGPDWLLDLVRARHPVIAHREASAWSRSFGIPILRVWRQALSPLEPRAVRRLRRRKHPSAIDEWLALTAVNRDLLADVRPADVLPQLADDRPRSWTRDMRDLFGVAATQADSNIATEAMFGVATADPTGDRRLLEVAFAQPERWRRHQGVSRAICRQAMSDVLPPEIVDRVSRGAQVPDWFDVLTSQRHLLAEEVEAARDHPTSRQVLDIPRLQHLITAWPDRARGNDPVVNRNYRLALTRGLLVSRYVRWFEQRARRVAGGGPAVDAAAIASDL